MQLQHFQSLLNLLSARTLYARLCGTHFYMYIEVLQILCKYHAKWSHDLFVHVMKADLFDFHILSWLYQTMHVLNKHS